MLELIGPQDRLCDRVTRRAMLRAGALAPLGLSLPALLATQSAQAAAQGAVHSGTFGRVKRCLLLYIWGGPSHQDIFDMKPTAPQIVRGEFRPIATSVPGIQICELLPKLARQVDKLALVRSLTHDDNNHSTAAHWMLTGRRHRIQAENFSASDDDAPHIGSIISKVAPIRSNLPTFVALPDRIKTEPLNAIVPGQTGGWLGKRYDPFRVDQKPDKPNFQIPSLQLPPGVEPLRVQARQNLLKSIDAARPALDRAGEVGAMNSYYQQALALIASPETRRAFDLAAEPAELRDHYGRHSYGQSLVLARRLLEADVKLVTVYWHRQVDTPFQMDEPRWDTHEDNFRKLKVLLPQVDQPIAALLEDLGQRGLLDDTLVVWSSEFGRSPKVNAAAGRDHWGACNTIWLAGAGIPGGQLYGSSDAQAAYPQSHPVHPEDLAATIYHLLGIPPETLIHDQLGRPLPISDGKPLERLFSASA